MGSSPIFRIIQKKVLTDVKSLGIISVIARKSISTKCDMRKCRNWQTSKTKDLVSIALVWVQVPSSAYRALDDSRAFLFARTGLFVLCGRLELCLRMSKKFICMFFLKKRGICCLTQNIINKRYFVILWRACL